MFYAIVLTWVVIDWQDDAYIVGEKQSCKLVCSNNIMLAIPQDSICSKHNGSFFRGQIYNLSETIKKNYK